MPDPIFPRDTYRPGDHEYDLDHLFDGEEEDGSLDLLCRLMETKPPLPEGEEEPEIIPGSQIERFLVCMMHGKNSDAYREVCQSAQKNFGPRAASSPQNAAWVKKSALCCWNSSPTPPTASPTPRSSAPSNSTPTSTATNRINSTPPYCIFRSGCF